MVAEAKRAMSAPSGVTGVLFRLSIRAHAVLYRLSGGRLGGAMAGVPVLLLDTVGRRSGKARTTPLVYMRDGERFVVIGSAGGAAQHPAWVHNLRQAARATVTVGRKRFAMTAAEANGEERARLLADFTAIFPRFADYQRHTSRELPVVVLSPPESMT